MDWARDGRSWPHAMHSRFIAVQPHRWHVQVAGAGPDLLLIHGAGGATQSWRGLLPLLAADHRVIAPDLPGQGFTRAGTRRRFGLDPMAEDLGRLLRAEGWRPRAIVGHSAGAAVALRLAELGHADTVIGINAALGAFEGIAGVVFPAMARLLALNPLVPALFSRLSGSEARVGRLLAATGSNLDAEGRALYRRLVADPGHVGGTLAMMAEWRLEGLLARLPETRARVLFLVGERDGTVPPGVSRRIAPLLPDAVVRSLGALGHLAHEEAPAFVADEIRRFLYPQ